jgi:hypothetical protein
MISGQIFSGSYLKPLKNVHVRCGNKSTRTDVNGSYRIAYSEGAPLTLTANEYSNQEIPSEHIDPSKANDFYLTPSSGSISQIIPSNGTQVVYWKNFEHVSDYEFVADTLLVLTYLPDENFQRDKHVNCMLSTLKYGEIVNRQVVPSHSADIYQHPSGQLYLYGSEYKHKISLGEKQVTWTELDSKQIVSFLEHAQYDNLLYSTEPTPVIPRVSHYIYDFDRDDKYLVRIVQDDEYFERAPDDFEMMNDAQLSLAEEVSNSSGVEIELLGPYIRNLYKYKSYSRPYSPAFIVNDTLLIFDHQNQWLYFHELDGVAIDKVGIYYNNLMNEELVSVIQDPVSQKLYTQHDKNGVQYIRLMDISTGSLGRPYKMKNPFPKKVKIDNGYIYYLYQTPIEDKKWHLVQEKLPF